MRLSSKRSGFTLVEVLFAFLVMTIGILSILALFLHGLRGLARTLESNRMAHAAANAAAAFEYLDLRNDANVNAAMAIPATPGAAVLIDPETTSAITAIGGAGATQRVTSVTNLIDHCVLENDLHWDPAARPQAVGGPLEIELRYSTAYLLRRPNKTDPLVSELSILVFDGRPMTRTTVAPYKAFDSISQITDGSGDTNYTYLTAVFTAGSYEVRITTTTMPPPAGGTSVPIPVGNTIGFYHWILDSTAGNGFFYPIKRVEPPPTAAPWEQIVILDRPSRANGTSATFLRYLATVVEMDELGTRP